MHQHVPRAHPHAHQHVLQLDIQGTPQRWISLEQAAGHYATDTVAWTDGDQPLALLRGGINVATGRQSLIEVHPIVALRGASHATLAYWPDGVHCIYNHAVERNALIADWLAQALATNSPRSGNP